MRLYLKYLCTIVVAILSWVLFVWIADRFGPAATHGWAMLYGYLTANVAIWAAYKVWRWIEVKR